MVAVDECAAVDPVSVLAREAEHVRHEPAPLRRDDADPEADRAKVADPTRVVEPGPKGIGARRVELLEQCGGLEEIAARVGDEIADVGADMTVPDEGPIDEHGVVVEVEHVVRPHVVVADRLRQAVRPGQQLVAVGAQRDELAAVRRGEVIRHQRRGHVSSSRTRFQPASSHDARKSGRTRRLQGNVMFASAERMLPCARPSRRASAFVVPRSQGGPRHPVRLLEPQRNRAGPVETAEEPGKRDARVFVRGRQPRLVEERLTCGKSSCSGVRARPSLACSETTFTTARRVAVRTRLTRRVAVSRDPCGRSTTASTASPSTARPSRSRTASFGSSIMHALHPRPRTAPCSRTGAQVSRWWVCREECAPHPSPQEVEDDDERRVDHDRRTGRTRHRREPGDRQGGARSRSPRPDSTSAIAARTVHEGDAQSEPNSVRGDDPVVALPGSLESTAAEIAGHGRRALIVPMDLIDLSSVEAAPATVLAEWGRIDVLFNNAIYQGRGTMDRILDMEMDDIDNAMRGNFAYQLRLIQLVVPHMLERGHGRIINMVSGSARHEPPGPAGAGGWGIGYAASKAAFGRVAGGIEAEFRDRGMRAFNVDPGQRRHREAPIAASGRRLRERLRIGPGRGHRRGRRLARRRATKPSASPGKWIYAPKLCADRGLLPGWPPEGVTP